MDLEKQTEPTSQELDQFSRRSTRVVLGIQVASQVIAIVFLFVLYRKIDREQYGLLGMVLPVIMFIRMFSTQSMNIATIQSQSLSKPQLSTLFWMTTAVGLGSTILIAGTGPFLASIYAVPSVAILTWALSGTALLSSLGIHHQAILERGLRIKTVAVIRFVALVVGGVAAIIASFYGLGVWALVIQQYVELTMMAALFWSYCDFRPKMTFAWRDIKSELRFGSLYTTSSLVFYLAQNMDKLFLSWMIGQTESGRVLVGMYSQAYNQMMKPVYLVTSPITGVMLPILSRAKDDRKLFSNMVGDFNRLISIILMPTGIGLMLVGKEAFLVLGGPQWGFAGQVLQALAPIVIAQGLINICGSVLAAKGRSGVLLFGSIAMAFVLAKAFLIGYFLGILQFETTQAATLAMAWSYSLTTVLVICVPYLIFCFRSCDVGHKTVLEKLGRVISLSFAMGIVVLLIEYGFRNIEVTPLIKLTVKVVAGVIAYLLIAKDELRWFIEHYMSMSKSSHNGGSETEDVA